MIRTLGHRGPDGFSVMALPGAVLAHARLAIIDLVTGTREPWRELVPPGAPGYATISNIVIAPEANAYAYAWFLPLTTLYEVTGLR